MLVGRAAEQRRIGALLAGARVGDSGVLVLRGEPGIGKTTLLEDAAAQAHGMRVLRARGVESERLVPFAGLLQLLRPLLDLLDHIPSPQAAALSAALLLDRAERSDPTRYAVGAATLSLLCRAAEDRAQLVVVDDAHLLDAPSVDALVFAARRLLTDSIAVLVGVRAGEPGVEPWAVLPTMEVAGLEVDAAALLLANTTRPVRPDQLLRLHRATAGNPLALMEIGERAELLDTLPEQSPLTVSEQLSRAFLGRVRGLDEDARAALLVAAADSTSASVARSACAVLGIPPRGLADAADAGLIAVRDDRLEFRHPLVRSAVYAASEPEARRAAHRALAAVLPAGEPDRLAWHLSESAVPPDPATAALLAGVAAQASARGAYAIAADACARAAELTPESTDRAAYLAAAAEAAWQAGRSDLTLGLLDRTLAADPDPLLRARVLGLRGAVQTRSGSLEAARTTLWQAAEAVEDVDAATAIRLYADVVHVSFYLGEPAGALRASTAIDRLVPCTEDAGARLIGSVATGMAMILGGTGAQGTERVRDAAYELVASADERADSFRLPLRVQGALWLRDTGPDRTVVAATVERMRAEAALGSLPYLLFHSARDAATTDRWDDAEAWYLEAISLSRETGQSTDLGVSLAGLACLYARRGQASDCLDTAAAARELCQRNQIRLGLFWVEFALGDLALGQGDVSRATDHYEALESALAAADVADPDQSCAPELVEAYTRLGRRDDAVAVAAEFHSRAATKAQPWSLARAERALALCAVGQAAREHFAAAAEYHARTPDRFERARTELALGSALRRDRKPTDARAVLTSAFVAFDSLGAEPWAAAAAHELRAAGGTAVRRPSSPTEALTPQERQIAQLLADGRTTKQAAAALFLSPKTVEYHLRHVYIKLGVRSRSDLAELFGVRHAEHG